MPGKRKGRKKGVAVDWSKVPGGLNRRSVEMNLDFARLKPTNWLSLSFGFLSFRTVATDNGSQKSHFYFLPVHHLLSATTVSRLFTSTFDPPCVPEEFSKMPEAHIIYESPMVPDSVRSFLSTAAFRFPYVYIFGSCTTDAFALDLLAIEKGWQKLPPMSYPKGEPKAICIREHTYVFGTSYPRTPDDAAFFVDVFDEFHHDWTPIDPGHSMSDMDPLVVPLKDWNTDNDYYILLHDARRHELHLYGTSEGGLALLPERSFHVRKQPAMLNGVLYCYKQHGLERYHDDEGLGEVVGYNLNGDPISWWTPIPVLGMSEHLSSSPVCDVHLLAIKEDSILCVLFSWNSLHCSYYDKSWPQGHNVRYVECYFFRMSIHNKPDEEANLLIKADHLFTTQFSIPGSSCLVDCLFV